MKVMFAHSNSNNNQECAHEAYDLPKRKVFNWQQYDQTVRKWPHSNAGIEFHVDGPTKAKLWGPKCAIVVMWQKQPDLHMQSDSE